MVSHSQAPTSKLLELIKSSKPTNDEIEDTQKTVNITTKKRKETKLKSAQNKEEQGVEKRDDISISSNYYKVPNIIDDQIVGTLSTTEEIVYRHIIRLSWGWNRNWCKVGTHYFQEKSSIKSRKAIRDAINRLLEKQLIKYHTINDKVDRDQDGTVYIIPLPEVSSILPNSILGNNTLGILPNDPIKYIYKDSLKNTLSPDQIVLIFYNGIDQKKISQKKRERAKTCFEELIQDGFTNDDIQFAVEWTLTNMKEKPYDFSIIKDTISQAMAQKDKIQKEQKMQMEKEISKTQKEKQEKEEEKERENIIAIKQNLSETERSELRNRALEIIKNTEGINENLITEILIEAKENEILRTLRKPNDH